MKSTAVTEDLAEKLKRKAWGRKIKITATLVLLGGLYFAADWRKVLETLTTLDGMYFALALALFIPQTLVSAARWQRLVMHLCKLSLKQSLWHTMAASAWNLIFPSKLGDLAKAAMIPCAGINKKTAACGRVILEKAFDLTALGALLLGGITGRAIEISIVAAAGAVLANLMLRRQASQNNKDALEKDRTAAGARAWWGVSILSSSLVLWTLHLMQIDLFLRSAGVNVAWDVSLARVPVAVLAGLLPLSFCGIGTRDAALVWLFADVAPASTMAGVGVLTALRYLIPGVCGIPFAGKNLPAELGAVLASLSNKTVKDEAVTDSPPQTGTLIPRPHFLQPLWRRLRGNIAEGAEDKII